MNIKSVKGSTTNRFRTPYNAYMPNTIGANRIKRVNRVFMSKGWSFVDSENGISEFAQFPIITHFVNIFSCYPSTLKYDLICSYDLFMNRVLGVEKSFYADVLQTPSYGNDETYISFICFGCKKMNCFYYITIEPYEKTKGVKAITVTCLFNPKEDSILMLNKIKNEVFFNLPEMNISEKRCLNILIQTPSGFELNPIEVKCPDIDFDLNYNPDFKPIHDVILERLSEDKSKGLVLLHGKAGTGKTNYIRYLINHLKKKVIYIPPNMTNSISDPSLIKFFINHSNSILVIEDAENVLMKRASNSTQAIANILNLTDGLLSDCTNIQVIATFNSDILSIDEALLRKGRLIAKYEFGELESEITEKLAIKIGSDIRGKKVLADIYNSKDESFSNKKEQIGFNK